MAENSTKHSCEKSLKQRCIIVGASHGGVSAAFSLRKDGWHGEIILIDADPALPYHRPPLSKAFLTDITSAQPALLKPEKIYEKENIHLKLGETVEAINANEKTLTLNTGEQISYDKLVLSVGARAFIPPINGVSNAKQLFTLRNQRDVIQIRETYNASKSKNIVIIGGGYIGLETAASLRKLGADVTVLERESRLLARVTSPEMSAYFEQLHHSQGVNIHTSSNVLAISESNDQQVVMCEGGREFIADIIIVGVGVKVNLALAEVAGLTCENGIKVNEYCQTSNNNIYAIGDCSYHYNQQYDNWLRLESVQNAVDQGKVAAAHLCGKDITYNALPWFWSDQFDTKLQIAGLSQGYDNLVIRKEAEEDRKFSVWYFQGEKLLAVDAVNNAKAYVLATKALKNNLLINKTTLSDSQVELKSVLA